MYAPAWGWTLEGTDGGQEVRRSFGVILRGGLVPEVLIVCDDLDEEGRGGVSFPSSSAKLRSFGACFCGLLDLVLWSFDEALMEVVVVVEGVSTSLSFPSSSSSARRRKFFPRLPMTITVVVGREWRR